LCTFLGDTGAIEAVVVGVVVAAGTAAICAGPETPTSAGFDDCFEHALSPSNIPRITKPAIIASFLWRDQDESVVPVNVLLVVALLVDFQVVDMFTSRCLKQSQEIKARVRPIQALLIQRRLAARRCHPPSSTNHAVSPQTRASACGGVSKPCHPERSMNFVKRN
jgi:hypothetical protein